MLRPNTTLQHGRYRIIRPIGQGGMGAVYEAHDNRLNNRVALKEALVSDAKLLRAFEREAQRLDRLRHPALPTVKDHFAEGGGQYLVMEYIDGLDLRQMLHQRGRPFPVAQVLGWADGLLDALTYLHTRTPPLIHRDIKPANLKQTPDGQIILLDFGLAKGGLADRTLPGRSLHGFTLGYAPPEQIQGEPTDERSDLYGLGATLYTLLTGQVPDDPFSRQKYIEDGYADSQQLADQVNPQVPRHVAQALQRAMALDPKQRPASAAQMRSMLKAPVIEAPVPPFDRRRGASSAAAPPTQTTDRYSPRPLPSTGSQTGRARATGGGNRQAWPLWGAIIGALLLFGTLVGAYFVYYSDESQTPTPTVIAESETPTPTTLIAEKDGMTLLYVSEGEFEMGSADDDPDADDDERPRHTVYLDAFWIDQTEVTNAMFANFVEQTGYQTEADKEGFGWAWDGNNWERIVGASWLHPRGPESDLNDRESHPVVQVSRNDAAAYCGWAERRLPTEAEWEKAAGGTDGRKWPWGDEAPTGERLNFCDQSCSFDHQDPKTNDGYEFTSPVGSYPAGASPYGALDMAGNAWEWVADAYDPNYYASSPPNNPPGPPPQEDQVLRGGSWYDIPLYTRVRNRNWHGANERGEYDGFRCARSP